MDLNNEGFFEQPKQEQGEPVAYIHRNEYNEYRLEPHDNFDIKSIPFNVDVPLFKSPQQRTWVGLTHDERLEIRSRVQEYTPIDSVKYGEAIQYATEQALMKKNA